MDRVRDAFDYSKSPCVSIIGFELDVMLSFNKTDTSRQRYAECLNTQHRRLLCGTSEGIETSVCHVGKAIRKWRAEATDLILKDLLLAMPLP